MTVFWMTVDNGQMWSDQGIGEWEGGRRADGGGKKLDFLTPLLTSIYDFIKRQKCSGAHHEHKGSHKNVKKFIANPNRELRANRRRARRCDPALLIGNPFSICMPLFLIGMGRPLKGRGSQKTCLNVCVFSAVDRAH